MADRFPGYDVLAKRDGPSWNAATRAVIDARLALAVDESVLGPERTATLQAIVARIVPQPRGRPPVNAAALVIDKIAQDAGDGHRPEDLPRGTIERVTLVARWAGEIRARSPGADVVVGGSGLLALTDGDAPAIGPSAVGSSPMRSPVEHTIDVVYDGEDLATIAAWAECSIDEVVRRHFLAGSDVFGLAGDFERAGPVRQAADEAALLQRRDQPMHAGLALEVERFLHFLERGGNARLLQLALDEQKEFVLLGRQHQALSLNVGPKPGRCSVLERTRNN